MSQLAEARHTFLVENGYPKHYQDLIDAKGTSDNEYDPICRVYLIKRRPECSSDANTFFHLLDKKREETIRQDRSRRWHEHIRVVSKDQQNSRFSVLPENLPIDYYSPDFFNALQPRIRSHVAIPEVALLPDVSQSFTWMADERISNDAFNKKYASTVLAKYELVDPEELGEEADDEWEMDADNVSESTADFSESEMQEIRDTQASLASHLSENEVHGS